MTVVELCQTKLDEAMCSQRIDTDLSVMALDSPTCFTHPHFYLLHCFVFPPSRLCTKKSGALNSLWFPQQMSLYRTCLCFPELQNIVTRKSVYNRLHKISRCKWKLRSLDDYSWNSPVSDLILKNVFRCCAVSRTDVQTDRHSDFSVRSAGRWRLLKM